MQAFLRSLQSQMPLDPVYVEEEIQRLFSFDESLAQAAMDIYLTLHEAAKSGVSQIDMPMASLGIYPSDISKWLEAEGFFVLVKDRMLQIRWGKDDQVPRIQGRKSTIGDFHRIVKPQGFRFLSTGLLEIMSFLERKAKEGRFETSIPTDIIESCVGSGNIKNLQSWLVDQGFHSTLKEGKLWISWRPEKARLPPEDNIAAVPQGPMVAQMQDLSKYGIPHSLRSTIPQYIRDRAHLGRVYIENHQTLYKGLDYRKEIRAWLENEGFEVSFKDMLIVRWPKS